MNNDLISRSALLEKAVWMVEYDESGCGFDLKAVPIEDVLKAPAVEAVEVCRCKDCKHYCPYEGEEHKGDCAELVGLESCVYEDDFCSYGEKRSGEHE